MQASIERNIQFVFLLPSLFILIDRSAVFIFIYFGRIGAGALGIQIEGPAFHTYIDRSEFFIVNYLFWLYRCWGLGHSN
jgi:hypothetical protein